MAAHVNAAFFEFVAESLTDHQPKAGSIWVVKGIAERRALRPDEAGHDALIVAEKLGNDSVSKSWHL